MFFEVVMLGTDGREGMEISVAVGIPEVRTETVPVGMPSSPT